VHQSECEQSFVGGVGFVLL